MKRTGYLRHLLVLALSIVAYIGGSTESAAVTILNFSVLDSASSNLTLTHTVTPSSSVSVFTSTGPTAVNIASAASPDMLGTAYMSFVNVSSSVSPNSATNSQSGFDGKIIFSKSATDNSGANLILQLDFTNAILSLFGTNSSVFSAFNSGTHTLAMSSYYVRPNVREGASITLLLTSSTSFTPIDRSFVTNATPSSGTISAANVYVVPEPGMLSLSVLAMVGHLAYGLKRRGRVLI